MIEKLLKSLWPLLKVRVVARLSEYIQDFATRSKFPLTDAQADALAALVVEFITDLIERDADPAALDRASSALSAPPVG